MLVSKCGGVKGELNLKRKVDLSLLHPMSVLTREHKESKLPNGHLEKTPHSQTRHPKAH